MCQQDLENMLHQGQDFYTRLVDHLMILKQNIGDFKNARTMQAGEVCKQLGLPPPAVGFGGPMGGAPQGLPPVMKNAGFDFFIPP